MLRCLLKRQWKLAVGLILLFAALFFLYRHGLYSSISDVLQNDAVRTYMENSNVSDREAFFRQLNQDTAEATAVMDAIMRFEGYEGERPEDDDPMAALTGHSSLANYDMLVWRSQMQQLPGKIGERIADDFIIIRSIQDRVSMQEDFEGLIGNHKELMRRAIRRGGEKKPLYEAAQAELNAIELDFPVQDTLHAQYIIIETERDWYILVLAALTAFTVFSQNNQMKVSRVIATSKLGPFRYTVSQLAVTMLLTAVVYVLHCLLMIFVVADGRWSEITWDIPIQAVTGFQSMMMNLAFGEYLFRVLALKGLLCMALVSLVLLISALSPNSIISLIGAAAVSGGLIYADQLLPQTNGLLVGRCKFLFDQLCYVNMSGRAVPYSLLYLAGLLAAMVVLWGLLLLLAPAAIRKWGK